MNQRFAPITNRFKESSQYGFLFKLTALALAMALVVLGAGVALADDISNNLDAGVDADIESTTLAPAGTKVVTFRVITQNDDGKSGCNLTGSTTLGVSVASDDAAVASVSPAALTFGSCGDTKDVTVTAVAGGEATISLTQTSNSTSGTFNLAPAKFKVVVANTNTAPQLSVNGVSHGASYQHGSVPAASCVVSDAEDSNEAATPVVGAVTGPQAALGLGSQTVTCSYTDAGNLTATDSKTYSIVDTAPPTLSVTSGPANPSSGTSATFVFSGSPTGPGSVSFQCRLDSSDDTAWSSCASGKQYTGLSDGSHAFELKATDSAGNSASATPFTWTQDSTVPTIDITSGPTNPTKSDSATFTFTGDPTGPGAVSFRCRLDSSSPDDWSACASSVTRSDLADGSHTFEVEARDSAGNPAIDTWTWTSDTQAPALSCGSADSDWHKDNVSIGCTASDSGTGLASSADASFSLATTVGTGTETGDAQTDSRLVCDVADNCATAGPIGGNKIDRKAPAVSCGSADGNWHDVNVGVTCSAGDGGSLLATDSPSSFVLSTDVQTGTETSNAATQPRTICDTVGNCTTAGPIGGHKVDMKNPIYLCSTPPNAWQGTNVTLTCTAEDGGSGLATPSLASFNLVTSVSAGQETDAAATGAQVLTDAVGNTVTAGPVTGIKVDRKIPTVTCGAPDGEWHAQDVSISCTASDGGSGLANTADASFSLSTAVAAGTEDANASTGTKTVLDGVGNSATAGAVAGNKVDKKAPTNTTFTGSITDGASYYFGSVPATSTCSAEDAGSGFKDCTVTGYGTTVGSYTLTANARDNVLNTDTSATLDYSVLAWRINGFYNPVDMNGIVNTVKGGSTVPLKFEVFAGERELKDVGTIDSLTAKGTSCTGTGVDAVEVTATGGTSLRFDTSGDQFIYNWQTPRNPGACYTVTVTTDDGSFVSAKFQMK